MNNGDSNDKKTTMEYLSTLREGARMLSIFFRGAVKVADLITETMEESKAGYDVDRVVRRESYRKRAISSSSRVIGRNGEELTDIDTTITVNPKKKSKNIPTPLEDDDDDDFDNW